MPKKDTRQTGKRHRRGDPDRGGPNRRATDHIMLAARKSGDKVKSDFDPRISASVQEAISGMVQRSSAFIEDQMLAGQAAAERMRDGIANSRQLNADVNMLVENLVATTKDVATTWLDLISIIVRSMGVQPQPGGGGSNGGRPQQPSPGRTASRTGTSGNAATASSITPLDSTIVGVPPQIVVKGARVKNVFLDLRPRVPGFSPLVRQLVGSDPQFSFDTAKFTMGSDPPRFVLTVNVPDNLPAGTYTGAVVDSSTNVAGGTLSVTVAD